MAHVPALGQLQPLSNGAMYAATLVEHSVVWIPYGWAVILVNCTEKSDFPMSLVIPYLNAKLAVSYPSIMRLVNFN